MTEEYFEYNEPAAIGVSFRRSGKIYYFRPNGLRVRQGEQVVAETDKGLDIGEVVFVKYDSRGIEDGQQLKPLLRKATAEDLERERELQQKEREARRLCEEKIVEHKLPMRLIAADYTFDGQRLVFFFSAEGRVDFRVLVRDLAETFKTRIELRQVGVRDQAKMVGGLGPCGRPLCCNAFLRNFDPVGIRVAKDQGLSLNPAKISGICDRLMCCLKFEHETYKDLARKLPKVGEPVNTPKGPAVVKQINLMHERVKVQYPDGDFEELKAAHVWAEGAAPPEDLPATAESAPAAPGLELLSERQPRERRSGATQRGSRPPRRERERTPTLRQPQERDKPAPPEPAAAAPAEPEATGTSRRKRRRRSDRGRKPAEAAAAQPAAAAEASRPAPPPQAQQGPAQAADGAEAPKRRRRPRSRGRRKSPPTNQE